MKFDAFGTSKHGEGKSLSKNCFATLISTLGRFNRANKKNLSYTLLSAYEVKNNCCLFERLFKVKKNGVFLFGISFFVLEIFTFLYYANEGSDDVIDCSTKTIKY